MPDQFISDMTRRVDSAAERLRSGKARHAGHRIMNVSSLIQDAFTKAHKLVIDGKAAAKLKRILTEHNDPHARESLQNFLCYNDFAELLIKSHGANCKYINTVLKTDRQLIIRIDKQVLRHVEYVRIIRGHLLELTSPYPLSLTEKKSAGHPNKILLEKSKDAEYTCTFLASAVIYGLITVPFFHKLLLKLKFEDISLDPVSIKLRYKASDVYTRYYLPFPASAYFLRYFLFREHLHRQRHHRKVINPSFTLNKDSHIQQHQVSALFTKWTKDVLSRYDISIAKGLTPPQFYKAVLTLSLLTSESENAPSYPPFILSVLSRKIPSYSLHDRYLQNLSQRFSRFDNKTEKPLNKRKQEIKSVLHKAVSRISSVRMKLDRKAHTLADRIALAEQMMKILTGYKDMLSEDDFDNLSLYVGWLCFMLREQKHLKMNAINDYASMVPTLLYKMAGATAFRRQKPEIRDEFIRQTIHDYRNDSIVDHLKNFCNYVATELGAQFKKPNWAAPELQKEEIPTPKSLISYSDIIASLAMCNTLFSKYASRFVNPKLVKKAQQYAVLNANAYRQIIALGYFAGLRISEILRLQLNHVIFDGGIVITIRRAKTRNGIRNIPLHLLMPDDILRDFVSYITDIRNTHPFVNTPLFGRRKQETRNYDLFSQTTVRKSIQSIFQSLGYTEFVFHHLRHSFANWFLIRWFAAFNLKLIPQDTPFLKDEPFRPKYLHRIAVLTLGANYHHCGQEAFTYAMAALARLMGHGGPIVTLQTYVHNTDWLFYLLAKSQEPKSIHITSKDASDFMQITYPTLPSPFKGRGYKQVAAEELLNYQRNFIVFDK